MLGSMTERKPQQQEVVPDQFEEFMQYVTNPMAIRPKKMNIKEFLRNIEEIYSYRFDFKSVTATKKTETPP